MGQISQESSEVYRDAFFDIPQRTAEPPCTHDVQAVVETVETSKMQNIDSGDDVLVVVYIARDDSIKGICELLPKFN